MRLRVVMCLHDYQKLQHCTRFTTLRMRRCRGVMRLSVCRGVMRLRVVMCLHRTIRKCST